MDLTRQIIELLSVPPGSFIYHLATLFALQVVFAISFSRWRRRPNDEHARNMAWAAAAIFFGQVMLLFAGLYFAREPEVAATVLPPLDQAITTASVALLVWSLLPPPEGHPRTLDIILIAVLIISGVMYLFFAQEWQRLVSTGQTAYLATPQAATWLLLQIATLATGLGYLLFRGRFLGAFPPIIIGTLLVGHIVQLWNYPEFVPTDTNIAYWGRLGNLIAYPLWAVYAYLHAMTPLLASESKLQESLEAFGASFEQAAQVIATRQPQRRLAYSLKLANEMFDTPFAAIGLLDSKDRASVNFYGVLREQGPAEIRNWKLDLEKNPILGAAITQNRSTEILRDGLGSRQLDTFCEAAGIEPTRSLLIYPLSVSGNSLGLLVLPAPASAEQWPEELAALVPGAAHFVTQALLNSQTPAPAASITPEPAPQPVVSVVPAAIVMDTARVQDLKYEVEKLRSELEESEAKRHQAEASAISAQKQARYLAAALRAVQSSGTESLSTPSEFDLPGESSQEETPAENQS